MNNFYLEKIIVRWYGPLAFKGEANLRPGVNLLLGKNGSGKTRSLKMIDNASRNQQGYNPESAKSEIEKITDEQLVYISIKDANNQQTVAFLKSGSWQSPDMLQNKIKFISSDRSVKGQLATANPFKSISDFTISDQTEEINIVEEFNKAVISELLRVIKDSGQKVPELTKRIEDHYQLGLVDFEKSIKIDFDRDPPAFFLDYLNREVQLTELSAGEKEYLYFLAFLYRVRDEKEKIILIDEPELHLHSSQIRKLCELISLLAKENQVLIATHSGDILHHFLNEANIVLLAKGEIKNIEVNEEIEKVVDQLGLPIDPSFFTSHWVCAENDPETTLKGENAPKTRELLSWIFGKDIKKRFWSFGTLKSRAEARIEVLQDVNRNVTPIKLSILFDGDRQINSSDEFPPSTPESDASKGIFYLPFWEIENIFLIPELLNRIIPKSNSKSGNDLVWVEINNKKENLFKSLVSTTVKNIVLRKFKYEYFPKGTVEELDNWKSKASELSLNQEELQEKFDSVVSSKDWKWIPGKEVLGIVLGLNGDFWEEVRKLVDSEEFVSLLGQNEYINNLKENVNKND